MGWNWFYYLRDQLQFSMPWSGICRHPWKPSLPSFAEKRRRKFSIKLETFLSPDINPYGSFAYLHGGDYLLPFERKRQKDVWKKKKLDEEQKWSSVLYWTWQQTLCWGIYKWCSCIVPFLCKFEDFSMERGPLSTINFYFADSTRFLWLSDSFIFILFCKFCFVNNWYYRKITPILMEFILEMIKMEGSIK